MSSPLLYPISLSINRSFFFSLFIFLFAHDFLDFRRMWEMFSCVEAQTTPSVFNCAKCGRVYKTKYTLRRHERLECGLPAKYKCRACNYLSKHKHSIKQHYETVHKKISAHSHYLDWNHQFAITIKPMYQCWKTLPQSQSIRIYVEENQIEW